LSASEFGSTRISDYSNKFKFVNPISGTI